MFTLGLDARDVYEQANAAEGPLEPFDRWKAVHGAGLPPEGSFVAHAVIEAHVEGDRALIDLTFGQLRQAHRIAVPMSVVDFEEGWPSIEGDGWSVRYIDSPHAEQVQAALDNAPANEPFVEELHALTELALRCDLDADRSFEAFAKRNPQRFAIAWNRLQRLCSV